MKIQALRGASLPPTRFSKFGVVPHDMEACMLFVLEKQMLLCEFPAAAKESKLPVLQNERTAPHNPALCCHSSASRGSLETGGGVS